MMNWNRFDRRAMMLWAPDPARAASVKRELDRVGLEVCPFWSSPDRYEKVIEDHISHSRMCSSSYLSITLNHFRMIKTIYTLGAQRALFLENDVRFLNDVKMLENIVDSVPEDANVALFDWVQRNKASDEEYRSISDASRVNDFWVPFKDLRSAACYMLDRAAMERFISILERPADGYGKLKIVDQHWWDLLRDGTLKGYAAVPPACVQGVPGGNTGSDNMWRRYNLAGVKREEYAAS